MWNISVFGKAIWTRYYFAYQMKKDEFITLESYSDHTGMNNGWEKYLDL